MPGGVGTESEGTVMNKQNTIEPPKSSDVIKFIADHPKKWSGDAYGYHPKGVIVDNILFVDEWNTNGYTSIYLAPENCEWIPAANSREASIGGSEYNAIPRPKERELIKIYWSGSWSGVVEDGVKERVAEILGKFLTKHNSPLN